MKRILIAAVVVLALAGCTAATPKAETAKPTPSPTPTPMSIAEAGTYYLNAVCPGNKIADKMNADFDASDLASIQTDAASARDIYQEQARVLDDKKTLWPDGIAPDLKVLVASDLLSASSFDEMSRATSIADVIAAQVTGDTAKASASAQAIRLHLNLTANTSTSCGQ